MINANRFRLNSQCGDQLQTLSVLNQQTVTVTVKLILISVFLGLFFSPGGGLFFKNF